MQQPRLARAGPPPPSGHILRAADNEPSSCWRKAVENGDPFRGVILGALRGTYIYTLLDWHRTSHPQSRNSAIYAAFEMPPVASEKNLTSLFWALVALLRRMVMIFVCVDVHVVGLPINRVIVLVQEEEQWLFLSRKASLRKRSLKHLVDEARCLQSDALHHNITGQYDRKKRFLRVKKKTQTDFYVNLLIKN